MTNLEFFNTTFNIRILMTNIEIFKRFTQVIRSRLIWFDSKAIPIKVKKPYPSPVSVHGRLPNGPCYRSGILVKP